LKKVYSERYVALKLGPDWTRENVKYYKGRYGKKQGKWGKIFFI
jgi:hypothetical protein